MSVSMSIPRRTQEERSALSREALLQAAARAISRRGYANLKLEQVAESAGYSRGAIYHQFTNKDDLVGSVIGWVATEWYREVWEEAVLDNPVEALVSIARGHVTFCRRDISRVMMALRVEFDDQQHPLGDALQLVVDDLVNKFADLVHKARDVPGPVDARSTLIARAGLGAIEGLAIEIAGKTATDVDLAESIIRGLLDGAR